MSDLSGEPTVITDHCMEFAEVRERLAISE
jgi:hypothetical protein